METTTPPQPAAAGPAHTWDHGHTVLLDALASRLAGQRAADSASLTAVTVLTQTADPLRADRLRPCAGDSAALVERLAAWALRRVDAAAAAHAFTVLHHRPDLEGTA